MAREEITDHAAQAIARLPGFQQEGLNWGRLLRALVGPVQDLETAFAQLLDERSVGAAVGAQLDGIGTILVLTRTGGESDTDYRGRLQGQASQLAKSGEIETVIAAWRLVWAPVTTVDRVILEELQPATIIVTAVMDDETSPSPSFDAAAAATMEKVVAAGVGIALLVSQSPEFLWGNEADADANGDLVAGPNGFADEADADGNGDIAPGDGGGNFARVIQ